MQDEILKIIKKNLQNRKLVRNGDKVLVAFSGGSDSVFLLYSMKELADEMGFCLSAAHLNHAIRACADDEEEFARNLCKKWNIDFYSKRADIPNIAKEKGISSETAGRNARYDFFDELRKEHGFTKIATAHHMDDNAETILMHFIRGSGANGLKGIEYIRDNLIIRPLLNLSKQDIYNACKRLGLEYVTDKSNFEPVYTRNKIRLELIPEIKKYNPDFAATVTANASLFAEDEDFINRYTKKVFDENYNEGFPKKTADGLPKAIRRRIIQILYMKASGKDQMLSQKYTDAALSLTNGKSVSLPGGISLYLTSGKYSAVKKNENTGFFYKIEIEREIYIPEADESWKIVKCKNYSYDSFCLPENAAIVIRSRQDGDRFYPIGMNGSKSISDFFTDKKIPVYKRGCVPVLTADGEIVNIGGKYKDRRFYKKGSSIYRLEIKCGSDKL